VPAKEKLKESTTVFRTLAAAGGYSLLELQLQTGRTHQIRRQLADAGHPLAGDRRYRGPAPRGLDRLFLHCSRLALHDPFDHTPVNIVSDLPAVLTALLAALGMEGFAAGAPGHRDAPDHLSPR
jgi:23S rRNA-/tRNA-specific pseudouridylate synthase